MNDSSGEARGPQGARGPRRRIVFLTGVPNAGKTQVCQRVVELTRHKGLRVSGLITEARRLASGRVVQTVVNLRTGERRRLADYVGVDEGEPIGRGVAGRFSWTFVGDSVRWGRHELARCLSSRTDLLIIDQLGPLELLAGSGWANAVDVLRAASFDVALVVVNPLVLGELRGRLGNAAAVEVEVDPVTRDLLPSCLIGLVGGRSAADVRIPAGGPDLLAADIDGTLISAGEESPASGVTAGVLEAERAGVEIVVCTGRPTARALDVVRDLGIRRGFAISYGGAETRALAGDGIIAQVVVPQEALRTLEGITAALGLQASPHESPAGALRLVLTGEARQIDHAAMAVAESLPGVVRVSRPSPGVLAIQDAAATKRAALAALAGRLGVDAARAGYLGDAGDDAPALAWAGFGVAVASEGGAQEAQDAADLVIAPEQVPDLLVRLALARRLRGVC